MRGKANLATFLATFCKVRRICHPGAARAFAFRYPLAARIVSQLGEKFFKAVVHVTLGTSLATSGPLAQYSELATDNRLVGSSSPPSPTTQSRANRDFPNCRGMTRISRVSCARFVSFKREVCLRGHSGAFVSARKNPFPGNRDQFFWRLVRKRGLLSRKTAACVCLFR